MPEGGVERGVSCRVNLLKEFSVRPEKNEISPETERMNRKFSGKNVSEET